MNERSYLFPIGMLLLAALILGACGSSSRTTVSDTDLVDPAATAETRALYANLKQLAPDHVLFGHQDDLAYGVPWKAEPGRSDVKEVTGSYPAVYGWEIGDLEQGVAENLDDVNFEDMKRWIKEGYKRGGVITISWHMNNPASGGNSWDTTRAIHTILPGGEKHDLYTAWLDRFASFVGDLKAGAFQWLGFGHPIPIVFRPFHEHSGSWFWWGGNNVTPEEYVRLWRFTVEYLRDEKGLHNLLYAYATDRVPSEEAYLAHYPGDDYVDIMGYDDYGTLRQENGVERLAQQLSMVARIAEEHGKLAAFTETGAEGIPDSTWWTGTLLKAIQSDPMARRMSWVLVWRNANQADNPGHYYAPYPGHPASADFIRLYQDPFVLFEDELPPLYR